MSEGICDICETRPATVRAQVVRNGRRETVELCDFDYQRLARQQGRTSSPLESLFGRRGGSLFDEFFGDDPFGERAFGARVGRGPVGVGRQVPVRGGEVGDAGRARRASGIAERLSGHAEELLQAAARRAHELGQREVDTEHLLHALTESDVVGTVLDQFKVRTDDLRAQLESEAADRERPAEVEGDEIGVSPRLKDALSRAFRASGDLAHSYVGPEHLLMGWPRRARGSPRTCSAATA